MINSDFYCLLDNSNNNLLKNTFDIEFSFILKNRFYRNIDGEGNLYKIKKYSFLLKGKGLLSINFDNFSLKFFSSRFLLESDEHDFFCLINEHDSFLQKFEERWSNSLKNNQWIIPHVENKKNFGFPILNVCLVKKIINEKNWTLELIEK